MPIVDFQQSMEPFRLVSEWRTSAAHSWYLLTQEKKRPRYAYKEIWPSIVYAALRLSWKSTGQYIQYVSAPFSGPFCPSQERINSFQIDFNGITNNNHVWECRKIFEKIEFLFVLYFNALNENIRIYVWQHYMASCALFSCSPIKNKTYQAKNWNLYSWIHRPHHIHIID